MAFRWSVTLLLQSRNQYGTNLESRRLVDDSSWIPHFYVRKYPLPLVLTPLILSFQTYGSVPTFAYLLFLNTSFCSENVEFFASTDSSVNATRRKLSFQVTKVKVFYLFLHICKYTDKESIVVSSCPLSCAKGWVPRIWGPSSFNLTPQYLLVARLETSMLSSHEFNSCLRCNLFCPPSFSFLESCYANMHDARTPWRSIVCCCSSLILNIVFNLFKRLFCDLVSCSVLIDNISHFPLPKIHDSIHAEYLFIVYWELCFLFRAPNRITKISLVLTPI